MMADVWAAPKRFEKVFSEENRKRVDDFLRLPGWEAGWKTARQDTFASMLHKHFAGWRDSRDGKPEVYECQDELQKNNPIIFDAWLAVRDKIFAGHRLVRCYANGMCYGMDGTVHIDAHEPGNYTAVYYPHERWLPNWGGETMFYNQTKDRVMACFYPQPNSMVVFDGRIPHRANGTCRSYSGMRITLMWKTELMEKPDASVLQSA
jgi:SM-20-related protein